MPNARFPVAAGAPAVDDSVAAEDSVAVEEELLAPVELESEVESEPEVEAARELNSLLPLVIVVVAVELWVEADEVIKDEEEAAFATREDSRAMTEVAKL
jgi:hypothetical protein